MKYLRKLLLVLSLFVISNLTAQNPHPTVDSVKVRYKGLPGANLSNGISAVPEVSIFLKSGNVASKVFVKIVDIASNDIVYQVNYLLNSGAILDSSGQKLFERSGDYVFISLPQSVVLKPYTYQVYTEDAQNSATSSFSVIQ